MAGSRPIDQLVTLLYAQAVAFSLSWAIAYLVGHRVTRGHWLFSILFVAGIECAAVWVVVALGGGVPSTLGWLILATVMVAVISVTEHWNAVGHSCFSSTLSLSGLFLVYIGVVCFRLSLVRTICRASRFTCPPTTSLRTW